MSSVIAWAIVIGLLGWFFWESNMSPSAKACFAQGGTTYDHVSGCTRRIKIE